MILEPLTAESLERELVATPAIGELRAAAEGVPIYLVGGAVRDLLSGRPRGELDVAVEGDVGVLAARLGGVDVAHDRFGTAALEVGGTRVDLARTRSERYPAPGALPEVEPDSIEADLARRDFTVNAMAIPLVGEPRLIDPFGGREDLRAGLLRTLHEGSFRDDPTRALRAARYVARLGMELEQRTRALAGEADLTTVSQDRIRAELARLAVEPNAARGFELLGDLGLLSLAPDGADRARAVAELLENPSWATFADAAKSVITAAGGEGAGPAEDLAAIGHPSPSEAVGLAAGLRPEQIALARALGAEWLDRWLSDWREVRLEITGEDLISAGIAEGPAVGRGLAAALRAKLDGEISGREAELDTALEAARRQ